ncbi:hypothetical protein GCM10010160_23020 [Acrocarpospora corrugata]
MGQAPGVLAGGDLALHSCLPGAAGLAARVLGCQGLFRSFAYGVEAVVED